MCYIYIYEKNYFLLKDMNFKDTIGRAMFNVIGSISVTGWEDNIAKIVIIFNLLY